MRESNSLKEVSLIKIEKIKVKHLWHEMKGNHDKKKELEDFIMSKIFEFIVSTSEENLSLIEYWVQRTRQAREELKDGTAWYR